MRLLRCQDGWRMGGRVAVPGADVHCRVGSGSPLESPCWSGGWRQGGMGREEERWVVVAWEAGSWGSSVPSLQAQQTS